MTNVPPSWHPSSETVRELYETHAPQWDRDRGKGLFERGWLDRFTAGVAKGGAILDLGCGSGQPIATYLIERRFRITGVDTSPAMIALCQRRFPGHDWVVGDMRDIRLGRRFAGILAWDSFFHLTPDDQRLALETFSAHCAPSAMLMFTSGPAAGESIGSYRDDALYHASLDPQEYRELLASHRFQVLDYVAEDPECGGHTVWLAQKA